jgi:hypothetical protein
VIVGGQLLYNFNERRDNGLTASNRIELLLIIYLAEPLREFAVEDFAIGCIPGISM